MKMAGAAGVIAVAGMLAAGCSSGGGPVAKGTGSVGTVSVGTESTAPAAKLFADEFQGVCKGATVSRATAYSAAAPSHKVILFSPNGNDVVEDTTFLPQDWMVEFDANSDAYARVDTVACVEVKDEQPLKECTGYQDDGHDTANVVDLRSATYTVSVREATTGKELARPSFRAPTTPARCSCPSTTTRSARRTTRRLPRTIWWPS